MNSTIDIHQVFADYFKDDIISPIAYACSKKLSEGHICLDLDNYNSENATICSNDLIEKSKWITDKENEINAFIIKNNKIYMHRYFSYETEIIDAIQELIKHENSSNRIKNLLKEKSFIQQVFDENGSKVNWQLTAAILSYIHNLSIITGGPGTGKTTTIAKLLSIIFRINPDTKVALAAPTGKAAARIKESILLAKSQIKHLDKNIKFQFDKLQSSTIHRLLGYKKGTHYFKHNINNPLDYDIVIVDESSMIGISLMAKLISSIPSNKQIILLGDKNQLASVEAGSVFGDICQSQKETNFFKKSDLELLNKISNYTYNKSFLSIDKNLLSGHIIELQENYRFDKNKGIGQISNAVLNGSLNTENIKTFTQDNEVHLLSNYQNFKKFFIFYHDYILERDTLKALKTFSNIRLLSPIHQGHLSVDYFNHEIESYLKDKKLLSPKIGFYHNQPIMIIQNNYPQRLFNGDIGLIRKDKNGVLQAYFEDENGILKEINTNFINQYKTVFSMTIHKSQGSEFNQVAIVLPSLQKEKTILSKELLYTGLTRARKELWILSDIDTLEKISKTSVQRASEINTRLESRV